MTVEELNWAIQVAVNNITEEDCKGYVRHVNTNCMRLINGDRNMVKRQLIRGNHSLLLLSKMYLMYLYCNITYYRVQQSSCRSIQE